MDSCIDLFFFSFFPSRATPFASLWCVATLATAAHPVRSSPVFLLSSRCEFACSPFVARSSSPPRFGRPMTRPFAPRPASGRYSARDRREKRERAAGQPRGKGGRRRERARGGWRARGRGGGGGTRAAEGERVGGEPAGALGGGGGARDGHGAFARAPWRWRWWDSAKRIRSQQLRVWGTKKKRQNARGLAKAGRGGESGTSARSRRVAPCRFFRAARTTRSRPRQ